MMLASVRHDCRGRWGTRWRSHSGGKGRGGGGGSVIALPATCYYCVQILEENTIQRRAYLQDTGGIEASENARM